MQLYKWNQSIFSKESELNRQHFLNVWIIILNYLCFLVLDFILDQKRFVSVSNTMHNDYTFWKGTNMYHLGIDSLHLVPCIFEVPICSVLFERMRYDLLHKINAKLQKWLVRKSQGFKMYHICLVLHSTSYRFDDAISDPPVVPRGCQSV